MDARAWAVSQRSIKLPTSFKSLVQIQSNPRHIHSCRSAWQAIRPLSPQVHIKDLEPKFTPSLLPGHGKSTTATPAPKPFWDGEALRAFRDGQLQPLPPLWLRDHCQCSNCFHPLTKQRIYNTFEKNLPPPRIESCREIDKGFEIIWHDGHESFYTHDWLHGQDNGPLTQVRQGQLLDAKPWDSSIQDEPPQVEYDAVMQTEEGVRQWCRKIRMHGFCFVDGCPPTAEATKELMEKISFLRQTHYGGYWEVLSEMASIDTAYTSVALDAHIDTTYFSDPIGLQMFHLLSHEGGEGGESLLVDGAQAATAVYQQDPEAYEILSSVDVYYHASGDEGINFMAHRGFPVLEHDPEGGHLLRIRWNNADRASIGCPMHMKNRWYEAARLFNHFIADEKLRYWFKLQPGRPMIFDNWRVLHGRAAFTGRRRLGGGYINRDDFISRFKMLEFGKDKVMAATVTG